VDSRYDVVATDRLASADAAGRNALAGADFRRLNLLERKHLRDAVEGCDAIVHLAAFPSPLGQAPERVFRNNTGATYAVLEAAAAAGVSVAIVASSTSAIGMTYAPRDFSPAYVPIDEAHELRPADPYALSKQVDENSCAMMHRRSGMTVLAYRFHWVALAEEIAQRVRELEDDPARAARELWGYVDARDAAAACRLGVSAAGLGFAVMNIVAADSLSRVPTTDLVSRFHPMTEIRDGLEGTSSAWSISRARELIGYVPRFTWRDA
jgi:nucleoside-diphosphate-sugar epimerase